MKKKELLELIKGLNYESKKNNQEIQVLETELKMLQKETILINAETIKEIEKLETKLEILNSKIQWSEKQIGINKSEINELSKLINLQKVYIDKQINKRANYLNDKIFNLESKFQLLESTKKNSNRSHQRINKVYATAVFIDYNQHNTEPFFTSAKMINVIKDLDSIPYRTAQARFYRLLELNFILRTENDFYYFNLDLLEY